MHIICDITCDFKDSRSIKALYKKNPNLGKVLKNMLLGAVLRDRKYIPSLLKFIDTKTP